MNRRGAAALVLALLALPATAQEPPNRDYQPPVQGQALFDPRPAKRAAAEAEAARKKAEEAARLQSLQVDNPLNAAPPPAPMTATEPGAAAAPVPDTMTDGVTDGDAGTDPDLPVAEGYVPDADAAAAYTPPPPPPAVVAPVRSPVEQPRAYGYLVGDTLVQRVQLAVDGRPVELVELPRRDRYGVWIVRRGAAIEGRADGSRWLAMEYQIVNASKDVDVVRLPQLSLRTTTPEVFIEVPEWPITVGAITASLVRNQGGLLAMQPDRPVPTVALAPLRHRLSQVLAALGITLLAWLGWWRYREWRASQRLPFARAVRGLRGIDAAGDAAWRCLHQAFDAAAGRVIQRASLPVLFAARPELEAERAAIERFYTASAARFFGGESRTDVGLAALAARLRAIERAHER